VLPVGDVAVSALCTVSALVDRPLTLLPSEAVLFTASETLEAEMVEPLIRLTPPPPLTVTEI
jgi:hypothetical protein